MRAITNSLLTAQTEASGRPHVRVEALDALAGVARPHFARLYDGDEEPFHHAATMPADGSLVRVRLTESDGALYVQRVPNPGPASDFAAWTRLDTAATACNVAACSRGATVLVAFRDPANPRAVCVRESADSGATWSERRVAATLASGTVERLAASFGSAGAPAIFLAANDARLHVTTRTGSVWSAPAAHDYALADVTGLAVDNDTAWRLAVTGADATGRHRVWTASYDGAWSPLLEVTRADAGSGVTFAAPFLRLADVARLTVVERYTGAGAYQRPLMFNTLAATTFDANSWADPVPLEADAPHGIAVAGAAVAMTGDVSALWLAAPDGVWHAALDASPRDLSADVLSLAMRESPGGTITLALRNDDGRYDAVGHPASPIREGTELRVSPGYLTPVGEEVSEGPAFWVTGWERRYGGGEATLVVHADDGWTLLAAWRARRQFAWARGEAAIASILGFILQRVGLGLQSANPSDAMLAHRPAFTVHPGESGATAVRRLMDMVPDLLHFRGRIARLTLPQPTDAAGYAFGSYHPVHDIRLAASAPDATRVQVFGGATDGTTAVGEALDHRAIPLLGERLRQVNDLNQDTLAKVESHAAALLARARRDALSGELVAPPNVALEIHDVVAIHTPNTTAVERMRVAALDLDYRRTGTPRYQQKITLSGL
ncbi:MAG: hypothetical protein OXC99_11670 [Chloroflexi bacterium]|nr:hypothetical protein [Chloroflexota bacterium]